MLWRSRRDPLERVAVAPWSWGVCDVAGWGVQLDAARVRAEARAVGVRALEGGPAGYLRRGRDLCVPAGFLAAPIHRGALGLVDRYSAYLAGLRARFVVVAPTGEPSGPGGGSAPLDAQGWAELLDAIGAMTAVAHRHGLGLAVHPHYGSLLESPAQLERFLVGCEAELCLDLGDLALTGVDPVELIELAPHRIRHVQVKEVDQALAAAVREHRHGYWEAVFKGLFKPLGGAGESVGAVVEALRSAGYAGWLSLEVETMLAVEPPEGEGPCQAIGESLAFLRQALEG